MVSSYQAIILLQYNSDSDSLSYEELKANTHLSDDILKPQLAFLVKQKILTQEDEQYDLNLDYKSKKVCSIAAISCSCDGCPCLLADPCSTEHASQV